MISKMARILTIEANQKRLHDQLAVLVEYLGLRIIEVPLEPPKLKVINKQKSQ